jgi:hypothetical protein
VAWQIYYKMEDLFPVSWVALAARDAYPWRMFTDV